MRYIWSKTYVYKLKKLGFKRDARQQQNYKCEVIFFVFFFLLVICRWTGINYAVWMNDWDYVNY